ncbi:unnamed protein product [Lepeophtheirus salmonis]|uniref:(salmon louse) hypothetical protein n=1 Tax=Lepeophtheirus salmonis TaxID=72036 RepID=A0A7R8CQ70_LEPSM|nr:unnamed protein product [Lepeophtheirus salmonis]CAF2892454.1 unnamed protein product [Lepeophtheirus salmonis]
MDGSRRYFLLTLSLFVIEQLSGHLSNGQLANNIIGAEIDLNNSIPGIPEGGLYADVDLGCQGFHICKMDDRNHKIKYSFLCPNGTVFNQELFICDWWFNFDCSSAESFYYKNEEISNTNKSYLKTTERVSSSKSLPKIPVNSSELRLKPAPPLAISNIFHNNRYPNSIEPAPVVPNTSVTYNPKDIANNSFLHSDNLIQTPSITIIKSLPKSQHTFELPLNFEPLPQTISVKKSSSNERENSSFLIPTNTLSDINQREQKISNIKANSKTESQKSSIIASIFHPINFPITHPPKPIPIPLNHKLYTYKIIQKIPSTVNVTEIKIKKPSLTFDMEHPETSANIPTLNHEVPDLFPHPETHSEPSSAFIPELSHPSVHPFNVSNNKLGQLPSRFPHFHAYEEPHAAALNKYNKFPHFQRKLEKSPKSLKFDHEVPPFSVYSDLNLEAPQVDHEALFGLSKNTEEPANSHKFDYETTLTNREIPQVPFHSIFRPAVPNRIPDYQNIQVDPVFDPNALFEPSHLENALKNHEAPRVSPHSTIGRPPVRPRKKRNSKCSSPSTHSTNPKSFHSPSHSESGEKIQSKVQEQHHLSDPPRQGKVFPTINHHYFSALPVIESRIRPPTYAPSYASAPLLPIRKSYYRELTPSVRHYPVLSESRVSHTIIEQPRVEVKRTSSFEI